MKTVRVEWDRQVRCRNCGAVLEIGREDVSIKKEERLYDFPEHLQENFRWKLYVTCPECNSTADVVLQIPWKFRREWGQEGN